MARMAGLPSSPFRLDRVLAYCLGPKSSSIPVSTASNRARLAAVALRPAQARARKGADRPTIHNQRILHPTAAAARQAATSIPSRSRGGMSPALSLAAPAHSHPRPFLRRALYLPRRSDPPLLLQVKPTVTTTGMANNPADHMCSRNLLHLHPHGRTTMAPMWLQAAEV
jgi:hypothetical protein